MSDETSPAPQAAVATILIVDDDPDLQEFVCALFELEGYEPLAAFDVQTGLKLYNEVGPDIVLLDIMLPGVDGYEFLRVLREDLGAATPVVCVSARASQEDIARGREAGADDYVTKPFDFPQLLEVVKRNLAKAR